MLKETKGPNINWSAVEKALSEGTFSGYKMGVLEAEKLFADFLGQKMIPGRGGDAKLRYIAIFLSRAEQLKFSRDMSKKIISQPHFEISRDETKQAIQGYWQAMLDLDEAITALSTGQRIKLRINFYKEQTIKKIKIIAVILASLILLISFFNELAIGKKILFSLGNTTHYLVFIAGPWILGGFIALVILWLGWKILTKRGREF